MIVFVGEKDPIQSYLDSWGAPLARKIRTLSYEELFRARTLPVGTYIFGEIDLLDADTAARATRVWARLESEGHGVRLLNHPIRTLRRYELLRTLKEGGLNTFDVYRATEARWPARFPVFVRLGRVHGAPMTPLLHDCEALRVALREFIDAGFEREDTLIVEFCDTVDRRGLYRKYSAFVVGDRIVPGHVAFSTDWIVRSTRVHDDDLLREELGFVRTNPHENALRDIAALSGISYGRIDYGLLDGRVQTWEINTNPYLMAAEFGPPERRAACQRSAQDLNAAFGAIDSPVPPSVSMRNPLRQEWVQMRRRRLLHEGFRLVRLAPHALTVIETLTRCTEALRQRARDVVRHARWARPLR